jgi:geranylgeranyl diphosphate synthase type II
LGAYLGEAYQVADDIRDVLGDVASLGKPAGQDVLNARPSSAQALGLEGAIQHFDVLIAKAGESIPACNARDTLRQLVQLESERLVPKSMCDGYRKRTGKVKPVKAEKAAKSVKLPAATSKSFNAPR